jgi:type IV pilus assembly protein PilN
VGENAEAAGLPGERQEPVSESNKVDFELLADYNPASPEERKAVRKRAGAEEISASPENIGNQRQVSTGAVRPQAGKALSAGEGDGRPPYTGSPQAPVQPIRNPGHIIRDPLHPGGGPQ